MVNEVEHFLMCLFVICTSSSVKYLFMSFAYFLIGLFIFFCLVLGVFFFFGCVGFFLFCGRAFSSCGRREPLFIAVRGPLTIVASLVAEHRLQTRWLTGLVAPRHVGSSQTRARTRVPCISRQILNHCATREAPGVFNIF